MADKKLTSVSEVGLQDTTYIFAETADGVHKVSSDEFDNSLKYGTFTPIENSYYDRVELSSVNSFYKVGHIATLSMYIDCVTSGNNTWIDIGTVDIKPCTSVIFEVPIVNCRVFITTDGRVRAHKGTSGTNACFTVTYGC